MKNNASICLIIPIFLSIFLALTPAKAATKCITTGGGYASYEAGPIQKVYDLSVSLSPEDKVCLTGVIREYLAQGLLLTPKAGITVEYTWAPEKGIVHVHPVGSTTGYWVLKECLKNCR